MTDLPSAGSASIELRSNLQSLQILRGLAAIAVVVYHTNLILAQPEYGGLDVMHAVASKGWLGVNLFFALSGFIIIYAHDKDIGHPNAIGGYVWKRFCRIYPLYWLVLTAYIGAAHLGLGKRESWTLIDLVSAYSLLGFHGALALPLKVAWSLFYEIHFYLAFMLFLLNRWIGIVGFAIWAGAIIVGTVVGLGPDTTMLTAWNFYFFVGMAVYGLYRFVPRHLGLPITVAGGLMLVAFVCGFATDRIGEAQNSALTLVVVAVPFGALILGLTLMERAGLLRCPMALVFIGGASYSIYLVHSPIISAIAMLNHRLAPGLLPAPLLFLITAMASTVAGLVAHVLIERPLLAACRRFGARGLRGADRMTPQLERA